MSIITPLKYNASSDDYLSVIQQIRNAVQEPGRYVEDRPVLPPRNQVRPKEWIDLVLCTDDGDDKTITLRMRRENLYVDGYMVKNQDNGEEVWYEFDNSTGTDHLIPGSSFLGFDGSNEAFPLINRKTVLYAINALSDFKTESNSKAFYLMVLINLICEASRVASIANLLDAAMKNPITPPVSIEEYYIGLVHGWGDISLMMIKADAFGGQPILLPEDNNWRQHIKKPTDAAQHYGLLLGSPDYRKANLVRPTSSSIPAGSPMVDVLSFRILDTSEDVSRLWINLNDGLGSQTLFSGDGAMPLRKLERSISAGTSFEIFYRLVSPDPLSRLHYWSIYQVTDSYARPITVTAEGSSLELTYAIFPDAWQLTWAATLLTSGTLSLVYIYGTITASYTYQGTEYEITLFSRSSGVPLPFLNGGSLSLERLTQAVPVGVEVTIEVSMWKSEGDSSMIQGRTTFPVGVGDSWNGSYELPVSGPDGTVTFTVAYSRVPQPSK